MFKFLFHLCKDYGKLVNRRLPHYEKLESVLLLSVCFVMYAFSFLVSFGGSLCFGVPQGSFFVPLTLFFSGFISVGGCPEDPEWLSALHLFCL